MNSARSPSNFLTKDRPRIIKALEYLEQQGWVEVEAADLRYRYTLIRQPENMDDVITALTRRFEHREQLEVRRVAQILELVTLDGCQSNALAAYFGESRNEPCGHCTWCNSGKPQVLPVPRPVPQLPAGLDVPTFRGLRTKHAAALGHPRQAARFLCGLNSPRLTKDKLSRHELFGVFDGRRFADVLAWVPE